MFNKVSLLLRSPTKWYRGLDDKVGAIFMILFFGSGALYILVSTFAELWQSDPARAVLLGMFLGLLALAVILVATLESLEDFGNPLVPVLILMMFGQGIVLIVSQLWQVNLWAALTWIVLFPLALPLWVFGALEIADRIAARFGSQDIVRLGQAGLVGLRLAWLLPLLPVVTAGFFVSWWKSPDSFLGPWLFLTPWMVVLKGITAAGLVNVAADFLLLVAKGGLFQGRYESHPGYVWINKRTRTIMHQASHRDVYDSHHGHGSWERRESALGGFLLLLRLVVWLATISIPMTYISDYYGVEIDSRALAGMGWMIAICGLASFVGIAFLEDYLANHKSA